MQFSDTTNKNCFTCNILLIRNKKEAFADFATRNFCTSKCRYKKGMSNETKNKISLALKGKLPKNFQLIKNYINQEGRKQSEYTRNKIASSNLGRKVWNKGVKSLICGDKHPNWQGGKTKINTKIRNSAEYREWRKSVFVRDNYTCQMCFVQGGLLHADHIKQFAYYPELRFELSNGRTLCVPCHKTTDTYMWKSIRNFTNKEKTHAV